MEKKNKAYFSKLRQVCLRQKSYHKENTIPINSMMDKGSGRFNQSDTVEMDHHKGHSLLKKNRMNLIQKKKTKNIDKTSRLDVDSELLHLATFDSKEMFGQIDLMNSSKTRKKAGEWLSTDEFLLDRPASKNSNTGHKNSKTKKSVSPTQKTGVTQETIVKNKNIAPEY